MQVCTRGRVVRRWCRRWISSRRSSTTRILYGQIAAANSLSDVYAMGGRPLTALAIAAFPQDGLHTDDIAQIFRGGFDKLREAGVALLGGHTVQDREIKFGYAVTGAVDPKRILTNAGAKPGDRLILTKPLGTGIVGTAIKFGRASDDLIDRAVAQMRTLNKSGGRSDRERGRRPRVHRHHRLRSRRPRIGNGGRQQRDDRRSTRTRCRSFRACSRSPRRTVPGGWQHNSEHFAPGIEIRPGFPTIAGTSSSTRKPRADF